MFEKIRPLHDKILVERVEQEQKTASGLFIPDSAKEEAQTGKVLAVGAGRLVNGELRPLEVKKGETIFFGKYAGTKAGDKFLIIREDEILGVVEQ
jgi:chaperonin GroES